MWRLRDMSSSPLMPCSMSVSRDLAMPSMPPCFLRVAWSFSLTMVVRVV